MKGHLKVENIRIAAQGKEIVKGVSLEVKPGQIVAIMGPNGSGKSTLANAIMGHPEYEVTAGKIVLDGEDLTPLSVDQRAKKGLFLSFQYPSAIEGVTISNFLRTARNAVKNITMNVIEFNNLLKEKMNLLCIDQKFISRYLNQGFSGGEKKKAEILQLAILEPSVAILDETDSGLDVDALKVVAEGITKTRTKEMGILIITHYCRILDYLKPDVVHVMLNGRIVKTGSSELAKELEKSGYAKYQKLSVIQ
ncbi:Fe-S cluster assembly ATPase SufC [Candidatus Woesearchaeota archaeon]|nr:Fe-S cluster assembly ATPase SufC [Candidatus Woesearchaeota archaeon]